MKIPQLHSNLCLAVAGGPGDDDCICGANRAAPTSGLLSPDCETYLSQSDLSSSDSPAHGDQMATLRDEEGLPLITVTRAIHINDLRNLLNYGRSEFRRGYTAGSNELVRKFQMLLQVEPKREDDGK